MSILPQISGQKLINAFKKDGWIKVSQKGSHVKLIKQHHPVGKSMVIVPLHKVLKKGTLKQLLKDAHMSLEKLKKLT